jgi:hypothetical protein
VYAAKPRRCRAWRVSSGDRGPTGHLENLGRGSKSDDALSVLWFERETPECQLVYQIFYRPVLCIQNVKIPRRQKQIRRRRESSAPENLCAIALRTLQTGTPADHTSSPSITTREPMSFSAICANASSTVASGSMVQRFRPFCSSRSFTVISRPLLLCPNFRRAVDTLSPAGYATLIWLNTGAADARVRPATQFRSWPLTGRPNPTRWTAF